jgi:polyhydroxyalkanoate synthesis repressor PhaR
MPRIVKRYENRKLYDTEEKRYVSLQEIAELVRAGHEVLVLDSDSGRDLTVQTLAKIIVDSDSGEAATLSSEFLHDLVRWGGKAMTAGIEQLQGGLDQLIQASLARLEPIQQLRADMAKLKAHVEKLEAVLPELEKGRRSTGTTESSSQMGAGSAPNPGLEGSSEEAILSPGVGGEV